MTEIGYDDVPQFDINEKIRLQLHNTRIQILDTNTLRPIISNSLIEGIIVNDLWQQRSTEETQKTWKWRIYATTLNFVQWISGGDNYELFYS